MIEIVRNIKRECINCGSIEYYVIKDMNNIEVNQCRICRRKYYTNPRVLKTKIVSKTIEIIIEVNHNIDCVYDKFTGGYDCLDYNRLIKKEENGDIIIFPEVEKYVKEHRIPYIPHSIYGKNSHFASINDITELSRYLIENNWNKCDCFGCRLEELLFQLRILLENLEFC